MVSGFRNILVIFSIFISSVPVLKADQHPILNGNTDKNKTPMYKSRNLCNGSTPDKTSLQDSLFSQLDLEEDRLDISYLLYTRENPQKEYYLQPNRSSISKSPFNSCIGSVFLIHGYSVDLKKPNVMFDIKDELLKEGEYNVVVVNWTKYDNESYYTEEITYRVPMVGREIAYMIKMLMNTASIIPESVYIVGHSLGAPIAGYAGKFIPNIGRITGLDAPRAGYALSPAELRLTKTDAIFVDAIHTDGNLNYFKGIGFKRPYGDQDFYPNGGKQQPKCKKGSRFQYTNKEYAYVDSDLKRISCNHDLATFYYANSINNCQFDAVLCDSYKSYKDGDCSGNTVARMGFHAKPIKTLPDTAKFYLKTTAESPYCLQ